MDRWDWVSGSAHTPVPACVWGQTWLVQRFCVVWGELVSCGIGRVGHDRNLEIGGDAGRGGQTRLGHWMWEPG